jgi:cytochrome c oxidase subunit 1
LHAIVYFWLFPAYIAFYTMAPREAGGRLFSDTMGRISFILFLLYSLPVGMHHLFMDPEHSSGFKFLQMVLTALVSVPTLLTVFTITASMELAGRMRGGKGLLGWVRTLPWDNPMTLATGLAFVMLFFGGGGGLVNMSYGMNAMIHNTSWVTAHFHLIFGGTVVIMYFAIAYAIWPSLTGREFLSLKRVRLQLWLWFVGMMVMTIPWHALGLQGQWRRVAAFDYTDPLIASWGPWVNVSLVGGVILLVSALLLVWNLLPAGLGRSSGETTYRYARAVHPPGRIPRALNGFGLWNVLVAVLMLAAYGWPIAQFFVDPPPQAVVHHVDRSID